MRMRFLAVISVLNFLVVWILVESGQKASWHPMLASFCNMEMDSIFFQQSTTTTQLIWTQLASSAILFSAGVHFFQGLEVPSH